MQSAEIEFHADDYGLFPAQSREILDCFQKGCLNAVSVMPNSPYLPECMEMLSPYEDKIKITVHLNLMEGYCLCVPEQVKHLVDERGVFCGSFGKLLLKDILPGRKEFREQLRKEISAQIHAVMAYLPPEMPLRIDGHAHYHMPPAVFDSLIQVIETERLNVEYIRVPSENWRIYVSVLMSIEHVRPINILKVAVLNLLAARNCRKHRKYLSSLEQRLFLGVALSGTMTKKNVSAILPKAVQEAEKKGWGIELLAHPGGVHDPEDISQLTHSNDIEFLTSTFRHKEKEMFCTIKAPQKKR